MSNTQSASRGRLGDVQIETLRLDGVKITSTGEELNILDGVTASATELNYLDTATPGTNVAGKALVTGATHKNVDELHTAALYLGANAGTLVAATAAELNATDGVANGAPTITVGAEAGDAIAVTIQLKDANAADVGTRQNIFAYLSNDANGDSLATSAPSGGVVIGTDGLLIPVVAGKAFHLTCESDGDIDLVITEAGGATWYLILVLPNGKLAPSGAITFAP